MPVIRKPHQFVFVPVHKMISSKRDTLSGGGDVGQVRANRFERPELIDGLVEIPVKNPVERRRH